MRINALSPAKNLAHFNTFKRNKPNKISVRNYDLIDSKKLVTVSSALVLATVTGAGIFIMKKNNTNLLEQFSKIKNSLKDIWKNPTDPVPVDKILEGKRDTAAVKKYERIVAQRKLESLNERIANGEFSNQPQRVFDALKKNERKLSAKIGVPPAFS